MSNALTHVHKGFGTVRPYLHGPIDFPEFLENTFEAVVLERNEDGPTLLQVGDSLIWVEAGELPPHVAPWVGSVYVYVEDVDTVYARAMEYGARSISAREYKPYNERQAGFVDAGGNKWWVSRYMGATTERAPRAETRGGSANLQRKRCVESRPRRTTIW